MCRQLPSMVLVGSLISLHSCILCPLHGQRITSYWKEDKNVVREESLTKE